MIRNLFYKGILFRVILSLGSLCAIVPSNAAPTKNVKWNPGHYILIQADNYFPGTLDRYLTDLGSGPQFKGFQIEYDWKQLEDVKGVYKLDAIKRDLKYLKDRNKKLSIIVKYKYTTLPSYIYNIPKVTVGTVTNVPAYFVQKVVRGNSGHIANFGHPDTLNAFKSLMNKMALEFDNDPGVAYLQFTETSSSADTLLYPNYAKLDPIYHTGIMKMNVHVGNVFLHTPAIQSLNQPRGLLQQYITNIKNSYMGYGGPDTFFAAFNTMKDPLTMLSIPDNPGIYVYNTKNNGVLPIGMQVHNKNLMYSSILNLEANKPHGLSATDSINELSLFLNGKLKSNFTSWQIFPGDSYYGPFKARIKNNSLPVLTACPTNFLSCSYLK